MSELDAEAQAKAFRRALLKRPGQLEALVGLGGALRSLGRFDEAEVQCRRALAIRPYEPQALRTLGGMLQLQGRYEEAIAIADAAIAAQPQSGEAWIARADSLANSGRQDEAVEAYARAAGDPEVAFDARLRIGKMQRVLGRPAEAKAAFDAAAALVPDSAEPQYERGLMALELRDFAQGWKGYETRWRLDRFPRGFIPAAMIPAIRTGLSPDDLQGRRVLLLGEQGVGDQIMFASMIPDLAAVAKSVICVCEPRLIRLFTASFPGVTFLPPNAARVDGDSVDILMAMGGLGHAFRPDAASFPATAYLTPREEVRRAWAERLGPKARRLRIGLSWRGGTPQTGRVGRSLPLEAFGPILDLPDAEFVNLQYGDVEAEIAAMNAGRSTPIRAFATADLDDFEDQAGLIANLDAVVSVQTAAVHLSGAVGTPCLALIAHNPEWRYMRAGETMPWYGSVRLARQPQAGQWDPVIEGIADALRGWA